MPVARTQAPEATNTGIQSQIAQAKAAGYSDDEITAHLSKMPGYSQKMKTATDAGYKPSEIVSHLGGGTANPWDNDPIYKPLAKASAPAGNPWDNDPIVSKESLYQALRNADAAGDTAGAKRLAQYIQPLQPEQAPKQADDTLTKLGKGAAMGIADIGNTVINAGVGAVGGLLPGVAQWNRTRNADMDYITDQNKDSTAFSVGRVGANIAATLPVGGIIGQGAKAVGLTTLGNAIASGGFSTGAAPGAINMLTRAAGGAINGAASTALVNPGDAGTGAIIGGVLPPALSGAGRVVGYTGRTANSLIQPFTASGQDAIAGNIIRRFADGGPTAINAAQIVPGSLPTLAEATGNAGIATLQRGARDLRPNAFAERETQNALARNSLFDRTAGDAGAIEAAITGRESAADALYGRAFTADGMRRDLSKSAQATKAPFAGVGLSGAAEDLATPGLRELASRPMFKQAVDDARKLAANKGVNLSDPLQSLQGLHYVKLALDDMANPAATTAMGRNAAGAVNDMRGKLAEELAKVSPLYGNARQTFAEMSQPINAMETLQKLKLTDAQGNITLAKVKNAIDGLETKMAAPGINPAKSVTADQLAALKAIHEDLLRQSSLGAGRSAGSNTFQNIATDNILSTLMPGNLGGAASGKIGSVLGQVGRLAYSGPNEAIRNRLADMMLQPQLAERVLNPQQAARRGTGLNALADVAAPSLYRIAPPAGASAQR